MASRQINHLGLASSGRLQGTYRRTVELDGNLDARRAMRSDRQERLRPLRRALLIGLASSGAAALGLWPARLHSREDAGIPGRDQKSTAATDPRAILYVEDPSRAGGGRFPGSVTWNADAESSGADRDLETVLRAGITIPERGMTLRLTFQHNDDPSLLLGYTIDLLFLLPPKSRHGSIRDIPAIMMKQREQWRGDPLKAVGAKVSDGYFIFGLSVAEADKETNLHLLHELDWFDAHRLQRWQTCDASVRERPIRRARL
jgi:hypothetical protein